MKPLIREAKPEDKPFIEEISKLTWEGEDYLARVFETWLKDGNFYVLELEGKLLEQRSSPSYPTKSAGLKALGFIPAIKSVALEEFCTTLCYKKGRHLQRKVL
ncbi:hypothetical protein [Thermococcus sp.]